MITVSDIRLSLQSFCDPATSLRIDEGLSSARTHIVRDGETRTYQFNLDSGSIQRHDANRTFINIRSLLASSDFADLRHMADTQQRILRDVVSQELLEPVLTLNGSSASLGHLKQALSTEPAQTRVVLLDGPAGIGKTRLIERLTAERATAYARGVNEPPILHVTSRGRRLSNLRDVLAASTQILRTKFTFEQVPTLIRHGLIVLAIDGFDELVDADGYKDAWYALRDFIEELDGKGTVILAGRDTFFDQQGFLTRLATKEQQLTVLLARLYPVSRDAARKWLRDRNWRASDLESDISDDVLREDSYALRPYFLSVLAKAGGWEALAGVSARSFLVERYLQREAALITERVSLDAHTAVPLLIRVFEEIALDMSERESDSVDIEYISLICEVVFESALSKEDLRKLGHKAGSFALLERDILDRMRRFPHSEIQFYFLARAVIRTVGVGEIPRTLRRNVLGSEFQQIFSELCDEFGANGTEPFVRKMRTVLEHEVSLDRLPQNAGALLILTLLSGSGSLDRVSGLQLDELVMPSVPASLTLHDVTIGQLDARGVSLGPITFERCKAFTLLADEETQFGSTAPEIATLNVAGPRGENTLRKPSEIAAWVESHGRVGVLGTKADSWIPKLPLVDLFERVCRRAVRQFYIRELDEDPGGVLLSDPLWPELEKILASENRIDWSTKPMHGPSSSLVRIKNPRSLLESSPSDEASRRIRRNVVERARALAAQ